MATNVVRDDVKGTYTLGKKEKRKCVKSLAILTNSCGQFKFSFFILVEELLPSRSSSYTEGLFVVFSTTLI